jgi:hypothetical protein
VCRRPRPWGQSGGRAKRRGGRGQPIPLLTLVGDVLWREIDGGGWSVTGATWNGDGGSSGEREVPGRCGARLRVALDYL